MNIKKLVEFAIKQGIYNSKEIQEYIRIHKKQDVQLSTIRTYTSLIRKRDQKIQKLEETEIKAIPSFKVGELVKFSISKQIVRIVSIQPEKNGVAFCRLSSRQITTTNQLEKLNLRIGDLVRIMSEDRESRIISVDNEYETAMVLGSKIPYLISQLTLVDREESK